LKEFTPQMLRELGAKQDTVEATFVRLEEFDANLYLQEMAKHDVQLISIEDEQYPSVLKEIGDPPVFLSYRGDLSLLKEPMIGCVGTREMSAYGQRVVRDFIPTFVRSGFVTVSGLALGVDAEVATETLHAQGRTIAALGNGLASIYPPSNKKLAEKIVQSGGLLLSEFALDMPAGKFTFPARNRIIAGLSKGTVVFEAPQQSGSIITADLALEYGRDVFAVPGQIFDPNFAGCHALIASGRAKLVTCASDVLQELGAVVSPQSSAKPFEASSPDEASVMGALTAMPQPVDALVEKTKISIPLVSAALTMLELQGAAKKVGAGEWVRAL
jgi:DNA processing protein